MPTYNSETEKIVDKVKHYFGKVSVDIGCQHHKVTDKCLGINTEYFSLVGLLIKDFQLVSKDAPELINFCDTVFSSHLLYTLDDWYAAIRDWTLLLKPSGRLILYLPDERLWDFSNNPKTKHRFSYEVFCENFLTAFPEYFFLDGGIDLGEDKYSFFVVFEKKDVVIKRAIPSKPRHKLGRATDADLSVLHEIYESASLEQKKSIQSIFDEIEYLRIEHKKLLEDLKNVVSEKAFSGSSNKI